MFDSTRWLRRFSLSLFLLCFVGHLGSAFADEPQLSSSADWTYWRGPLFDGAAQATGLAAEWDPEGGEGSNLIWKRTDMGGRSTPVVMNGKLYTLMRSEPATPREGEKVICVDAETGETIWENQFNVWLSDVPDTRVGWSSVVGDPETGNVYALGVCDIFLCINGQTGETIWSRPLHEEFGMLSTYGGRTNFPVVHEDLVIISGIVINYGDAAKPNHRLLGLDKHTGELVWFTGTRDLPDETTYSSPSLVTIDGQRQILLGAGDGSIWGFQPRTGKPLWRYDLSRRGVFATPLVVGNRFYSSHSEENMDGVTMGAIAATDITGVGTDTKATEAWKHDEIVVGRSAPVLVDGRLYVCDDKCKLWVIDAASGEMLAERITVGDRKQWSSLLFADNKLYAFTENGRWAIMTPSEDGVEFLSKGRVRDESFIGSPIVANGKLYVQGSAATYCIGTGQGKQANVSLAESLVGERPIEQNPEPTQLLVVPGELILRPGDTAELSVRLFNDLGQRLPDPDPAIVQYEVEGPGAIDGNTLTANPNAGHDAMSILARVGGVTGMTRARVIPPLPWSFNFDDLKDPPVTWVGARYRNIIKPIDGSPALVKITTIPKGTRSRAFLGNSDLHDYTVECDVRGSRMSDQLPDIGVSAQGYAMELMGASQQIQIRSWAPQLRTAADLDFSWEADRWYRMKLRAETQKNADGTPVVVVSGKVWPRGDKEPEDWMITARDENPTLSGSPSLYGNAKVAELYMDNLEVYANGDR